MIDQAQDHSAELTVEQFEHWRSLIESKIGIYLSSAQRRFLSMQLANRMQVAGVSSLTDYEAKLTGVAGIVEWSALVDHILVQETYFFRHRPSYEYLATYIDKQLSNNQILSSFDTWSVGCSTGEEAYSLAMTIDDAFRLANVDLSWGVTGTDVSHFALNKARQAVYGRKALAQLADGELSLHFTNSDEGKQVTQPIRDRVCFAQGNVIELKTAPTVLMDVIFCQNLLIYFKRWRRRDILSALAERLKPGGILVVGVGEIVDWEHPQLRRVKDDRAHVYIKI